ncbi:protein ABHD11-like [Actinia tenebrosa]|uniref:sn-1-specific diacylglycerol lipase ABHD11 n=1 Tax=Actinia tenebrosa TaxID=6105 RepID=A0A6P8IYG1_ACTTE|nr:protein ABHD11-like [Actinia tenebrosa]
MFRSTRKISLTILNSSRSNINYVSLRNVDIVRQSSSLITSSPVRLAYVRVEGKDTDPDPPLFICHGLFGAKKNWRSIAKALNRKTSREIVAIDARNHGNSDHHPEMNYFVQALDAKHLIQKLDIPKVIIIGHSMGGKVAMTMALSFPELVEKIIVVDSSPAPSISDEDIQRYLKTKMEMGQSKIRSKRDAEKMMMNTVNSRILRQFFLTNLIPSEEGYKWRINLEAIDNNLQYLMDFPSKFPHKQFNGEAIFIGGGRSRYIQEKDYDIIYKLFPKAEITFIPDCGHWVHAEKPRELMEIIQDFLMRYP